MADCQAPHILTASEKHLLRLVIKDKKADGWTPVSKPIMGLMRPLPSALVDVEDVGSEGRGRARLTKLGEDVLPWVIELPEQRKEDSGV